MGKRTAIAAVVALLLHVGLGGYIETAAPRIVRPEERVEMKMVRLPKIEREPPKVEEPPEPPPETPPEPKVEPPPPKEAPKEPDPPREKVVDDVPKDVVPNVPAEPAAPPPPDVPVAPPPSTMKPTTDVERETPDDSLMRLPKRKDGDTGGLMGRVLGENELGALAPSLTTLEGALDYRADKPMSDQERVATVAKRMIEDELASDVVDSGLADDYFREFKRRLDVAWKPAVKQLNDGGRQASRMGFMKDFGSNPRAFGEMWETYLDVAGQYARGQKPTITQKKREHLREVMRSRKGNFRVQAISELMLTQAPDGKILTIEVPLSSGHPNIDEGMRNAMVAAVAAMPDKPPSRLSRGRSFRSKWRMRATWRMVPPTALMSGASFDIGKNGLEADLPFAVKLKTNTMLLTFDNRGRSLSR